MSLFSSHLCVLCVVSTEQTLIDFVSGGAGVHAALSPWQQSIYAPG